MLPSEEKPELPLHSFTPMEWGKAVLTDPVTLLADHAHLEKKAANNALTLLARWPGEWVPGWLETMTSVARDEAAHLAQVVRLLTRRGGRLLRYHNNPYVAELRGLVRKGVTSEILDHLLVSALIEARSCERFSVLMKVAEDEELARFYRALYVSEMGHYKIFLKMAGKCAGKEATAARWQKMLAMEADIMARQEPGVRIHSGVA
jgi:tRNA-(ms[2]io[6]A)-hydroxylase